MAEPALPGGLRIAAPDPARAIRATVVAIVAVCAFIILLDAVLFREALKPDYLAKAIAPLWPRTPLAVLGSVMEEVVFRLAAMSALVAMPGLIGKKPVAAWVVFAIVAAQFFNVGELVLADPLYATPRYWLVGCVWGWLYWRHGFVSALLGHGLCHLLLDPALRAALLAGG
jgi:hypothetical protein